MATDMGDSWLLMRHRILWVGFASTVFVLLFFFLARTVAACAEAGEPFPELMQKLSALMLGVLVHLPFANDLWTVIPVFPLDAPEGPESIDRLEAFFLSPLVWVTASIAYVSARHARIVNRLKRALDEAPARWSSQSGGNQMGNIHAGGSIHIHQNVGGKPSEKPGSGVVMAAALSAAAAIICEVIKSWHGGG
jgi:hypothetical protein